MPSLGGCSSSPFLGPGRPPSPAARCPLNLLTSHHLASASRRSTAPVPFAIRLSSLASPVTSRSSGPVPPPVLGPGHLPSRGQVPPDRRTGGRPPPVATRRPLNIYRIGLGPGHLPSRGQVPPDRRTGGCGHSDRRGKPHKQNAKQGNMKFDGPV